MPRATRTTRTRTDTPADPEPLLRRTPPAGAEPAEFGTTRALEEFVVHDWHTALGTVGIGYHLIDANARASSLALAAYEQFGEHAHEVYDTLISVRYITNVHLTPTLEAVDLYPGSRTSAPYEITWKRLAGVLGQNAPWFHAFLRDRAALLDWKPDDAPIVVPAEDGEMPTGALTALAADEPDGSPAATVCLWLARALRRAATEGALKDIKELREEARQFSRTDSAPDCDFVHIAALPAPLLREEEDELPELVRRAGWAQVAERRDTHAAHVLQVVQWWNGGRDWPVGAAVQFNPDKGSVAAEWTARLVPAPREQSPTVLERWILSLGESADSEVLLHDEATGAPAVLRTHTRGERVVFAAAPQRISTEARLEELILSEHTVWIRTADGQLWLAPHVTGRGLSWGYSGGGPAALTNLVDQLLDDITARAVLDYGRPPKGLRQLIEGAPKDGTTVYTRGQLLAARAG